MDVLQFISRYNKILTDRMDDISQSISSGGASNWEDFRARVGEIQGVAYALDELKTLLKKVNYVEDTDST